MKSNQYLYLIRCGSSDFYKIGISDNIERRLLSLQIGCPYHHIVIYKRRFKRAIKIERFLHRMYWNKRRRIGPWFEFTKDDVDSIQKGIDKIPNDLTHYSQDDFTNSFKVK